METNNYQGHKKTLEQRLKESTKFNFQTMNKTKLCDLKKRTQKLKTKTQHVQNKHGNKSLLC
jgi:hypothetical protein